MPAPNATGATAAAPVATVALVSDTAGTTPNDGFDIVIAEPGVELAARRSGEGPTVLLVGGLGMPSITWDICGLPRSLVDAGFQVIAYNVRGVSPSSAPKYVARSVSAHRPFHVRHGTRPSHEWSMAGGGRHSLRRYRSGPADLRCNRAVDRPGNRCENDGRTHGRHGVAILSGAGPALRTRGRRDMDGSAGGRSCQRVG